MTSHISDKEILSRIQKTVMNQLIEDIQPSFYNEKICQERLQQIKYMNRLWYMKRYLASLVIRKMPSKIMKDHYTSIQMAVVIETDYTKWW